MTRYGIKRPKVRTKLLLITVMSLFLLPAVGCRGTIPEPLRGPAQEAIEQAVTSPGIDLHVNIGGLASSGLNVAIEARISNPNPITLDIGNLQVVAKGETGYTYVRDTIVGRSIAPNSSTIFNHSIVIPLDVLSERNMIVTVDTRAGAAGITLPVGATITVTTPDLQNLISAPEIALSINIGELSSNGLRTDLQASLNNPNPLSLDIGNMQIVVKGQAGSVITTSTMMGGSITPNSGGTFTSCITIPLQVLNERNIIVIIDTSAGVAGITLPITASVTVSIPDVQRLITAPKIKVAITDTSWVATFPLPSIKIMTETTVINNNNFDLSIGDLHISVYRSNGTLIKSIPPIVGGTIQAGTTRTFPNSTVLGSEILSAIGDYIIIKAHTEVGIEGVKERVPIESLEVYVPLRLPGFP